MRYPHIASAWLAANRRLAFPVTLLASSFILVGQTANVAQEPDPAPVPQVQSQPAVQIIGVPQIQPRPAGSGAGGLPPPSRTVYPPSSLQTAGGNVPQLQTQPFAVYPDYKEGNSIASSLREAPPKLYTFDRASLRDVLRFLADDAGIPFIALQERASASAADNVLVTFTMRASPFLVLESVAKANGVSLVYESGVWFIRPINEKELIGRTYKLKYTSQENIVFQGGSSGGSAPSQGAASNSNQNGQVGLPNVGNQQSQKVFKADEPPIIKEIKNMLKIPTKGMNGRLAPDGSVGNFPEMSSSQSINPSGANLNDDKAEGANEPSVTFNSDTGTIFIVATRQQHQWVEGFLSAVDQPQALVGIEVKFFETDKNPKEDLGIDWAGTFANGLTVGASDIKFSPGGSIDISRNMATQSQSGQLPAGSSPYNYNTTDRSYTGTLAAPYSAVISASNLAVTLQAFMQDANTTAVQYPRVLTINNREVAISSAENVPFQASSTSVTGGGTGTTANQTTYLPIGTQVNILPKVMPDNSVVLTVAITISAQTGTKIIGGNETPVTASRIYNAVLQVDSGYTLAVGGLDEVRDQADKNGIPYLKDIPGLGHLFKSKARDQKKRNLIIFITPTIMRSRSETTGVGEHPQTVLPARPGEPNPPTFTTGGQLAGGAAAIDEALRWLERQVLLFRQIVKESRTEKHTIDQIRGIVATAAAIQAEIDRLRVSNPRSASRFDAASVRIEQILTDLNTVMKSAKKDLF